MNAAAELLDGVLQDQIQPGPVAVPEEDRISGIATKDDMVDGTGEMEAGFSGHGGKLTAEYLNVKPDTDGRMKLKEKVSWLMGTVQQSLFPYLVGRRRFSWTPIWGKVPVQ